MKITVPFYNSVRYVPYRHENPHHVLVKCEAEVELREIGRSSVRPVLRLKDGTKAPILFSASDPWAPKPDGSAREVIDFEGALWVEVGDAGDMLARLASNGEKDTPFDKIDLHRVDRSSKNEKAAWGYTTQKYRVVKDRAEVERLAFDMLSRVHQRHAAEKGSLKSYSDDGGEGVRLSLSEIAGGLVCVNGVVYARVNEPCVMVDVEGGRVITKLQNGARREGGPYLVGSSEVMMSWYADRRWNLLQTEFAIAQAVEANPGAQIDRGHTIEILDQSVLHYAAHIPAMLKNSAQAVQCFFEQPAGLPPGTLECALELRDALSEAAGQITPRLLRALEGAAYIEAMPAEQRARWEGMAQDRPHDLPSASGRRLPAGEKGPATRAALILKHETECLQAADYAKRALERFSLRVPGNSWEERALAENVRYDGDTASYELLSWDAVDHHARTMGGDAAEFAKPASDGQWRVFVCGSSPDLDHLSFKADVLVAVVYGHGGPAIAKVLSRYPLEARQEELVLGHAAPGEILEPAEPVLAP